MGGGDRKLILVDFDDDKVQEEVINKLNPKIIVPIHTFHPERYKELFPNVLEVKDGIASNI